MAELIEKILTFLKDGEPVALATIANHSGSTPRKAGSKMVVNCSGEITGTVGGGILEAEVINNALRILKTGEAEVVSFDFRNTDTAESIDMICGGKVDVLIERLEANDAVIGLFESLVTVMASGNKCLLGHALPLNGRQVELFVADESGIITGLTKAKDMDLVSSALKRKSPSIHVFNDYKIILDPFFPETPVFILVLGTFQELSILLKRSGFVVVIIDDRPEYANQIRFPDADDIIIPESFDVSVKQLSLDLNSLVVIATRGHSLDESILEQVINLDLKYIGMMGSRVKKDTIYTHLRDKGVQQDKLDRVHSPIGIHINAETPEEIAVSIAAQLIEAKNS